MQLGEVGGGAAGCPALRVGGPGAATALQVPAEQFVDGVVNGLLPCGQERDQVDARTHRACRVSRSAAASSSTASAVAWAVASSSRSPIRIAYDTRND